MGAIGTFTANGETFITQAFLEEADPRFVQRDGDLVTIADRRYRLTSSLRWVEPFGVFGYSAVESPSLPIDKISGVGLE